MNRNSISLVAIASLLAIALNACVSPADSTPATTGPFSTHAVFVANEGTSTLPTTLDCYEPDVSKYTDDIYKNVNGTSIGNDITDLVLSGKDSLYVVVFNSNEIRLINRTTGALLMTYKLPSGTGPEKIVMVNDSQIAITAGNTSEVQLFNTHTGVVDKSFPIGPYPISIVKYGSVLFVGASGGSELDIIRLSNGSVSKLNVGQSPGSIVLLDNTTGVVICSGTYGVPNTASLRFFDPQSSLILGTVALPDHPFKLARDGNMLYVPCDSMVLRVDYTTRSVVDTFITKSAHIAPYGIAVDSVTHTVYLSDAKDYTQRGTLSVYNGQTKSLISQMPCGISPGTILITH